DQSPSFRQGRGVEGKRDVSRIRIEDLPPDRDLTPEDLEQTSGGAGRSVRPEVEGLEDRQLLAANLAGTLLHQPVADPAHVGPTVQQTPEMQVLHAPGQQGGRRDLLGGVNPLLAPSQAEANQAFSRQYLAWKGIYVTADGAGGNLRVRRTENND